VIITGITNGVLTYGYLSRYILVRKQRRDGRGVDDGEDASIAAMGCPGLDVEESLTEMTLPEFEIYFNS
jgi:hypothetical protein